MYQNITLKGKQFPLKYMKVDDYSVSNSVLLRNNTIH